MKNIKYVLITPARNEESYIENTIESVISQTILPKKWVIVSDGSTDRTDEIVARYEANYDFIQLLRREPSGKRNFASKIYAIRTGVERLNSIEYDFIGNLDADVSFEPSYYERILAKFKENPRIGIAGGIIFDNCGGKYIRQFSSTISVAGAIQMFRRQCYEDIGDYIPSKIGGEDAIAEVMARMHGWEVRSFPEIRVLHHRRTWTETRSIWSVRFHGGVLQYSLGYHWLFVLARSLYRIFEKPYFLGSMIVLCGYCWANLRNNERAIPDDVIKFLRREQLNKLLSIFSKYLDKNRT